MVIAYLCYVLRESMHSRICLSVSILTMIRTFSLVVTYFAGKDSLPTLSSPGIFLNPFLFRECIFTALSNGQESSCPLCKFPVVRRQVCSLRQKSNHPLKLTNLQVHPHPSVRHMTDAYRRITKALESIPPVVGRALTAPKTPSPLSSCTLPRKGGVKRKNATVLSIHSLTHSLPFIFSHSP